MCFGRKNKTLGAIFKQSKALAHLEDNYKTFMALKLGQEQGAVNDLTEVRMGGGSVHGCYAVVCDGPLQADAQVPGRVV